MAVNLALTHEPTTAAETAGKKLVAALLASDAIGDLVTQSITDLRKEVASVREEQAKEILAIRNTVISEKALNQIRAGWNKKRDSARNYFIVAIGVFAAILIAGVILFVLCAWPMFDRNNLPWDPTVIEMISAKLLIVLKLAVPLLAFVWMARFAARLALVALHEYQDAVERVMFSDTFVKLESRKLEADERKIVLAALFRPSEVRSVDDGAPLAIIEKAAESIVGSAKRP